MWDERYSEPGFAYGAEPNHFLVEQAHRIPPGPVLCLAEGEGRNAVWLAEQGHEVTAVDSSPVGLQKAEGLAWTRGVRLTTHCSDLRDYVIEPGAWSTIVSIFAHLPPEVRREVHRRVVEGLRPGGIFILEAYTPRQLDYGTGGPPAAEMMMDEETLRSELAGLDFQWLSEGEREVIEGQYHTGLAHVVQAVARKPE